MLGPSKKDARAHDPTFYPVEDHVGEDTLQTLILELLRPLVERWLAAKGKPTFVGADQFIYYQRFHAEKVVGPDLYVLPGVRPDRRVKSWKTWQTGVVPSFALEVLTLDDSEKDYYEAPARYAELGVNELCIFDADFELHEDRVRWQRFRRLPRRGFVRVESTNDDRIRSRVLGCFLRVIGEGNGARLRLGTGLTGDALFPTEAEAERAAKNEALAARDAERLAKEAAIREKEAAIRENAELKALLAKSRA